MCGLPKRLNIQKVYTELSVRHYDSGDLLGTIIVLDGLSLYEGKIELSNYFDIIQAIKDGSTGVFVTDMLDFLSEDVMNAGYNILYVDVTTGKFFDAYTEVIRGSGGVPVSSRFVEYMISVYHIMAFNHINFVILNLAYLVPVLKVDNNTANLMFNKILRTILTFSKSIHINFDGAYGYTPQFKNHVLSEVYRINTTVNGRSYTSITLSSNDEPGIIKKYEKMKEDGINSTLIGRIKNMFKGRI